MSYSLSRGSNFESTDVGAVAYLGPTKITLADQDRQDHTGVHTWHYSDTLLTLARTAALRPLHREKPGVSRTEFTSAS